MSEMRCAACPVPGHLPCSGPCDLVATGDPAWIRHVVGRAGLLASKPAMPSLARQAVNLATSVANHVAAGLPAATEAQREARLEICRTNRCGQFVDGRCALCGCRLRIKVGLANESCPHDPPLWGPVAEEVR